jgi:peroxiredoxin
VELQRSLADFEDVGIKVFSILYDPLPQLAQFAAEYHIEFPLLSDEGSREIREYGILNTLINPTSQSMAFHTRAPI